jgi:hypothetical protein
MSNNTGGTIAMQGRILRKSFLHKRGACCAGGVDSYLAYRTSFGSFASYVVHVILAHPLDGYGSGSKPTMRGLCLSGSA